MRILIIILLSFVVILMGKSKPKSYYVVSNKLITMANTKCESNDGLKLIRNQQMIKHIDSKIDGKYIEWYENNAKAVCWNKAEFDVNVKLYMGEE
jgi:hypothetical protein